MTVISDRSSVAGVATTTKSGADTALELGAKVLAQLATQAPSTTMNVPTSMMQDLAAAVVQLAAELKKAQATTTTTTGVPVNASPKINAQMRVTSGYTPSSSTAYDDLKAVASSVREKCAELGINLKVDVQSNFGSYFLNIEGQAPKTDLDKVKAHALDFARKSSQFATGSAKVEVLKYDVI